MQYAVLFWSYTRFFAKDPTEIGAVAKAELVRDLFERHSAKTDKLHSAFYLDAAAIFGRRLP